MEIKKVYYISFVQEFLMIERSLNPEWMSSLLGLVLIPMWIVSSPYLNPFQPLHPFVDEFYLIMTFRNSLLQKEGGVKSQKNNKCEILYSVK